jgi:hypothetical protein
MRLQLINSSGVQGGLPLENDRRSQLAEGLKVQEYSRREVDKLEIERQKKQVADTDLYTTQTKSLGMKDPLVPDASIYLKSPGRSM